MFSSKKGQQRPLLPCDLHMDVTLAECSWQQYASSLVSCGVEPSVCITQHAAGDFALPNVRRVITSCTTGLPMYPLLEEYIKKHVLPEGYITKAALHKNRPMHVPKLYYLLSCNL